jgi:diaminopimelate epimerase
MKIKFQKYQGTGNDFIIINNESLNFPQKNHQLISRLCDRKLGIGSDGLILITPSESLDYEMVYFNSDGNLGSMCGNGARCSVKFAQNNNLIKNQTIFNAFDGNHSATIVDNQVFLSMKDVLDIKSFGKDLILNTGSPHYIQIIEELDSFDVFKQGKKIRNSSEFKKEGINVNFVKIISDSEFYVRTFERGVENETLSCGTGVTAVALAMYYSGITKLKNLKINTNGGVLNVGFKPTDFGFEKIILSGNVELVYKGEFII